MELHVYQLVFLRRGENPPQLDEAAGEQLQRDHLAYLSGLGERGVLAVNGPVDEQGDSDLRGVSVYRCGSVAEARALAEADPAVRAGRLRVEAMTWWNQPGAIARPAELVRHVDVD
ncbi:YciI family protein [Calidifontibacter terrae]